MTDRPARDLKLSPEQLLDDLAQRDEAEATGAPQTNADADSTFKVLKAELDTLASQLREPAPVVPFEDESGCQRITELIEALGVEPTLAGMPRDNAGLADSLPLGDLGQYRLLAKLGEGGMGTVYKALHTRLDKVVALKVLPTERTSNLQAVARFEREMRAVGKLEHANIVRAMDANEHAGTHYLVMEYVDGVDLSELVHRIGPLPVADACELVRQAAVGLQNAHEHKLVHRDIKPSNLMLSRHGQVKILDLGLARLHEAAFGELTSTGQMMGTIDYMAPEQTGDSHEVDIRADIYGLGATLFKLLCDRAPYADKRLDTVVKKLKALATKPVPSVRELRDAVPVELDAIIRKMLGKEPEDRYATPQQVAEALRPFAEPSDLPALAASYEQHLATDEPISLPVLSSTEQYLTNAMTETKTTKVDEPAQAVADDVAGLPTAVAGLLTEPPATTEGLQAPGRPTVGSGAGAGDPRPASVSRPAAGRIGNRNRLLAIAAAFGGIILLGVVTLFFLTKDGTIVVEIDDPDGLIQVAVVGQDIVISEAQKEGEPIKLRPGDHKIHVTRGELEFDSDNFTLKRGKQIVLNVTLADGRVQVVRDNQILAGRDLPSTPSTNPDRATEMAAIDANAAVASKESPLDKLRREDIDPYELRVAGAGDPDKAPQELVAILGDSRLKHWHSVNAAVFTDVGKTLITSGTDGAVRIWDTATGRQNRVIASNVGSASFALSPDGKSLFVSGGGINVFNAQTGERIREPIAGGSIVALSPDGTKLVSGSHAGPPFHVFLHDATSGELLFRLGHHAGQVSSVAVHPLGKIAASSAYDSSIKLWDLTNGTELRTLTGHNGWVDAAAFSPDGSLIASASHDGTVRFWDPSNGEFLRTLDDKTLFDNTNTVQLSVAFSPDGSELAVGKQESRVIDLWDVSNGRQKKILLSPDPRETNFVVRYSPDGKTLMSGSATGFVRFWDLATEQQSIQPLRQQATLRDAALSPDGRLLATSSHDGTVMLWDLTQQQATRSIQVTDSAVGCVAFSPDGNTLATGSSYSPDGDYRTLLWNVATGELIKELYRHGNGVVSLAFTTDGSAVVAGDYNNLSVIVDVTTGEVRASLDRQGSIVRRVAVSPDGKLVATAFDSNITLWDAATGKTVHELRCEMTQQIAFSPDGKSLASGSAVRTIHIWDVATGEERRTLRWPWGYGMGGLSYAPDGKSVWCSAGDGTVRQWNPDAPAGASTLQRTIQIGPGFALDNFLAITPDGRHLVTANANGTIYVLKVDPSAPDHPVAE